MLSPREQAFRKNNSIKQSIKNPKLASMTNIANRSPLNKYENKEAITNNTLSSKKQLLEKDRTANTLNQQNSPRDSLSYPTQENGVKRTFSKPEETQPNAPVTDRNQGKIRNSVSDRPETNGKNLVLEKKVSGTKGISASNKLQTNKIVNLPNGDKYEGALLSGIYHGQGFYTFKGQNLRYQGQFLQGKQHGYGILFNLDTKQPIYEGSWQYGLKNGEGRYTYDKDEYYNGEWVNDEKQGAGIYTFQCGIYNGAWTKNKRQGKGSLKLHSGTEFKGTFENNEFVRGFVKYANGDEYSGELKNNRRVGDDGSYMQAATKIRYKGGWFNDKKHGRGTLTYENGDELTGTFQDGLLNEQFVVMYKWRDGTVFNGWFRNNQPNKGSVSHSNGEKWEI